MDGLEVLVTGLVLEARSVIGLNHAYSTRAIKCDILPSREHFCISTCTVLLSMQCIYNGGEKTKI